MLPVKQGQSPEDRARDIENALDWVRQVHSPPGVDEPIGDKLGSLPSLPVSRRTPEERLSQQEDVLNWLRGDKAPKLDTPQGLFNTIDQVLPPKEGQSPEDR